MVDILAPPLHAARRLARLAGRLPAELGDDGEWLSQAFGRFLDPFGCRSLEDSLDLPRNWRAAALRCFRDQALVEIAAYFQTLSRLRQAEEVHRLLRRYAATRWRRIDRSRGAMPAAYIGRVDPSSNRSSRHLSLLVAATDRCTRYWRLLRENHRNSEQPAEGRALRGVGINSGTARPDGLRERMELRLLVFVDDPHRIGAARAGQPREHLVDVFLWSPPHPTGQPRAWLPHGGRLWGA